MKNMRWAIIGLALAGPVHAQMVPSPTPVPLQRSISSSQQFIVYFQDKSVRSRIVRKLEDIKSEWLKRLDLHDDWKAPILVRIQTLRPPNSPKIATGVYESDSGELKIQIDVYEPSVIQTPDFEIEVYRALCLELAYRNTPIKAGKPFTEPPSWLVEGIYEEGQAEENGLPPGLYDTVIERGPSLKLDSFLKERVAMMDATSRAVFRAQAMGLLRSFLSLQNGTPSLVGYISKLPTISNSDPDPLIAAFPALGSDPKQQLSKLWVLSMADVSARGRMDALTVEETRKQLELILDVSPPLDPKKPKEKVEHGPAALPEIARSEQGKYILKQKADDLLRLEVRAHPLLRPMVAEYRSIVSQLALKPKKNVTARLTQNTELVAAIVEKSTKVEDYMNWYEATKLQTPSGNFTQAIDDSMANPPPRTDAISRYIDDVENRGW
jgi:hypothetical protein